MKKRKYAERNSWKTKITTKIPMNSGCVGEIEDDFDISFDLKI
jgi:hypothetical protein